MNERLIRSEEGMDLGCHCHLVAAASELISDHGARLCQLAKCATTVLQFYFVYYPHFVVYLICLARMEPAPTSTM